MDTTLPLGSLVLFEFFKASPTFVILNKIIHFSLNYHWTTYLAKFIYVDCRDLKNKMQCRATFNTISTSFEYKWSCQVRMIYLNNKQLRMIYIYIICVCVLILLRLYMVYHRILSIDQLSFSFIYYILVI